MVDNCRVSTVASGCTTKKANLAITVRKAGLNKKAPPAGGAYSLIHHIKNLLEYVIGKTYIVNTPDFWITEGCFVVFVEDICSTQFNN